MPARGWLGVVLIAAGATTAAADGQPAASTDRTTSIHDISQISAEQAASGRSVRIHGVVTWRWQPWHAHCVVQDDTGGIWVNIAAAKDQNIWAGSDADLEAIAVGDEVEIEGRLERGGYAPNILPITIEKRGSGPLPEPLKVDDERFFSGRDNLRRIVVEGVVQGVRDAGEQEWLLLMQRSGRPFVAKVPRSVAVDAASSLVDANVRLTGATGAAFNTRGQYLHPLVRVNAPADLEIVKPPPASTGEVMFTPLEELACFAAMPSGGHRVRTEGVVSYALPGEYFYVQAGSTGVRVAVRSSESPRPGDQVEIAGFIDRSRDFAGLSEAVYRVIGHANPPDPRRLSPAQIVDIARRARLKGQMAQPGDFDGCLIRFSAAVIDVRNTPEGGVLLLDADGERVIARLVREQAVQLPPLESGAFVDVTGVLQIDLGDRFRARPTAADAETGSMIDRLTLLVPSAASLRVLRAAPWWNARRLSLALMGLAVVLVAAVAWAGLLRRQVAIQAVRLAGEMQKRRDAAVEYEASLRERNRLAANLHDTLLQTLAGAGFQLDTCRRAVGREDLDETGEHLDVARRMLKHAVGELRGSVWALRTMPLAGKPFSDAIAAVVTHAGRGQQTRITVKEVGERFEIANFVAGNLLLVVQEAIRNAIHHARPKAVDVNLAYEVAERRITVMVEDDGCGFTIGSEAGPAQGHFGLQGMRERIGSLGGSFSIEASPGRGTRITASVTTPLFDRQLEGPPGRES